MAIMVCPLYCLTLSSSRESLNVLGLGRCPKDSNQLNSILS